MPNICLIIYCAYALVIYLVNIFIGMLPNAIIAYAKYRTDTLLHHKNTPEV